MTTTHTSAADMPVDEFTEALLAGRQAETLTGQAAVWLIAQTALPHRRDFRGMVELYTARSSETNTETLFAGIVWEKLAAKLPEMRLDSADGRLVRLALSYATGTPVDLRDVTSGHGSVHMGYVIEAARIATGAEDGDLYRLSEGPGLARIKAFNDELLGNAPAATVADLDVLLREGNAVALSFVHGQPGYEDEGGGVTEPVEEGYHATLHDTEGRQIGEGLATTPAGALSMILIPDPSQYSNEPPFDLETQPASDPGEFPAV